MTKTLFTLILFAVTQVSVGKDKAGTILIFGDSLSSVYGIDEGETWVDMLCNQVCDTHTLINASQNGRLLSDARKDLSAALQLHQPDCVVISLGTNDGNRRTSLRRIERSLNRLVEIARLHHATPLILVTALPPSTDPEYAFRHQQTLIQSSEMTNTPYSIWINNKFYEQPDNLQEDGLHPSQAAQKALYLKVRDLLGKRITVN